uniref:Uncharacterized protein n=1 Tax=Plectus sambesii TaxID=2011161 RepID=A0A914X6Q4_9BILA
MKYVTTVAELMLYPNDEFNGEEIRDENKQTVYYNVISNIRKIEDINEKVHYGVTVSRISCPLDTPEATNTIGKKFHSSLVDVLHEQHPGLPEVGPVKEEKLDPIDEEKSGSANAAKPKEKEAVESDEKKHKSEGKTNAVHQSQSELDAKLPSLQLPPQKGDKQLPSESFINTSTQRPTVQPPTRRILGGRLENPITALPDSAQYVNEEGGEGGDTTESNGYYNYEGDNEGGDSGGPVSNNNENAGNANTDEQGAVLDADNCFTSPSGHKCCSRKVEQMMKDMQKMVNEMDEHANETSIKHEMLGFIKEESEKRFCDSGSGQAFDVMIANGEFATEANVPKSEPNACKMEISLGGRRLKRAVNGVVQPVVKLVVLTKQI